jgi:photosystem II stability/assembly factor-like uncharacterized protein
MKLLVFMLLSVVVSASAQWQKMNVATTASFRGLSVVNENVVWASGTEGTIIRTVDGGKNWSVLRVPGAENLDFRGIKAFDERTAVIISSGPAEKGQARIYRTIDAGTTWKQVYEDKRAGVFFDAVAFWDHEHGIVLSDPVDGRFALFVTEDGGANWKQIAPSALSPALPNEGAFAASNSCLTVQGKNNVWFATGGARVARVFRSRDRGRTWDVSETPMHPANASSGIFSVAFADASNGVAAGGDYKRPDASELPNIMVTSDGGKSWQAGTPTAPAGIYLSAVSAEKNGELLAVGTKGLFVKAGDAWTPAIDDDLNAVVVLKRVSWAAGAKGTVVRRTKP